jgi:glycosyltransferase involved in cell wall biosynthesis
MIRGEPLVSVMMPAYNAAASLPLALASLAAQTYQNWECILVDDGSTDSTGELVERINEPRIRYIRLDKNRGRGVARQVALEEASGPYLSMLDADDWLYPQKLSRQVQVMMEVPEAAVVGTGVAIVDAQNEIVGVRSRGEAVGGSSLRGPIRRLGPPPMAFATSMIRAECAAGMKFDKEFLLAQDSDFLLRILLDRRYVLLHDVSYVYTERTSVTSGKILRSLVYTRRMYRKHRPRFPVASRMWEAKTVAKGVVYRALFAIGLEEWLIARRAQPAGSADVERFSAARASVTEAAERLFGSAGTVCGDRLVR